MPLKTTHIISIDIMKTDTPPVVRMKQGDRLTRELTVNLLCDGSVWAVPSDVAVLQLAYCKSDQVGGCYDHMPDNSVAGKFNSSRTAVTIQLHPQVLNVAGNVFCELRLITNSGDILSTFNFIINVQKSPIAMTTISEGYYNNVFDGATFTPHIDVNGILSWTNDKGLANPPDVNLGIASRSAVLYAKQELTDEQKAQARDNIGAVGKTYVDDSVASAIAGNLGAPVARALSADGIAYTATGDDLPTVSVADSGEQISAVGKGRQIVFVPDTQNASVAPTLQINDGEVIPIRLRAPKNQGENDDVPDATLQVPVGVLMRGVPYTMTFCGKYWLVDSLIDIHADEIGNTLRFEAQTLTDKQKKLARENIGAVSEDELKNAVKNASSRTTINVNLISENWEQIEDELFEQTVSTQILDDIDRDEDVLLQCCPEPKSIAAWNLYGIQCMNATNESLTFQAQTQPAENENIGVIIAVWR